jgi:hypothetical protein
LTGGAGTAPTATGAGAGGPYTAIDPGHNWDRWREEFRRKNGHYPTGQEIPPIIPQIQLHTGSTVYSDWFPRCGDYLIATLELIRANSAKIDVAVLTKNYEDTGPGTIVSAGITIVLSSPGRAYNEWSPSTGIGLKELVRYRFTCTVQSGFGATSSALFRMLSPVWFDAVTAPS